LASKADTATRQCCSYAGGARVRPEHEYKYPRHLSVSAFCVLVLSTFEATAGVGMCTLSAEEGQV
jgi:hypothetical protein